MTEKEEALVIYRLMRNALKTEGIKSLKVVMDKEGRIEIFTVLESKNSNPS